MDGLEPKVLANLMFSGWLPFSSGSTLVPKLHTERACILLSSWNLEKQLDQLQKAKNVNKS